MHHHEPAADSRLSTLQIIVIDRSLQTDSLCVFRRTSGGEASPSIDVSLITFNWFLVVFVESPANPVSLAAIEPEVPTPAGTSYTAVTSLQNKTTARSSTCARKHSALRNETLCQSLSALKHSSSGSAAAPDTTRPSSVARNLAEACSNLRPATARKRD